MDLGTVSKYSFWTLIYIWLGETGILVLLLHCYHTYTQAYSIRCCKDDPLLPVDLEI